MVTSIESGLAPMRCTEAIAWLRSLRISSSVGWMMVRSTLSRMMPRAAPMAEITSQFSAIWCGSCRVRAA